MHETVPDERAGMAAYHAMFEHTSEGVLFSTQDGRITAANPAASTLLGLGAEEICQLGMAGLVDHEDPRWGLALAERDRSGFWVGMLRLRRGDGRMVDMEATTRVFRDSEGAVQVLSILHDIAGRLAIEREMEELSARLLELSQGDELTGLHNRRGLLVAGNRLLQFADCEGAAVQALFADVENVQELNDRLGLRGGDAALEAVARAPVGLVPQERRPGPHRRHPVPRAGAQPERTRLRHHHAPHRGPPRRSGHGRIRRCVGRRLARLDDPAGR